MIKNYINPMAISQRIRITAKTIVIFAALSFIIVEYYYSYASDVSGGNGGTGYAEEWWDGRNPDYNDYTCHDCANFVSQCLKADGFTLDGSGIDTHGCFPSCDNLASWCAKNNSNSATRSTGGTVPSWVSSGCMVIFGDDNNLYRHATYVVDGSGSNISLNAHCSDRQGKSFS